MISGVRESRGTIPTERTVKEVFTFIIVDHTSQERNGRTLPLGTSISCRGKVANADKPFIGIIGDNESDALSAGTVQAAEGIIVGSEACRGSQVMVAETVGIGQYIVTLYFRFVLFELTHFRLAGAQGGYISFYRIVIYLNNRLIRPSVIGTIIHREYGSEIKVFQKVHLSINIARSAVILSTGGIGFQIHIHHRVHHLCLLELRQSGI